MKKIRNVFCTLLTASLVVSTSLSFVGCGKSKVPQYDGYKLLWNDEFNGSELNEKNWNKEVRPSGWTNNELQAYTKNKENIYVKNGKLVLQANQHFLKSGSAFYDSGKIQSMSKREFKYGRVVARAKTPKGQGLWPAIWMMPAKEVYGNWPVSGEIDIMEVLGHQTNKTYGTIHYGTPHGQKQGVYFTQDGAPDFSDDFHEYMIDWEPGELRWYVDGELFYTENNWFAKSRAGEFFEYPAPFDQEFYIQMNLAVGGDWPGKPDETTDFKNAKFEVDYIRVYQKESYDENVVRPSSKMPAMDENNNYVHNGDFAKVESLSDSEDWTFLLANGGKGSAKIENNQLIIESSNAGTVDYSVQLVQPNIGQKRGKKYVIKFDAKASEERTVKVAITAPNVNWIRYFPDTKTQIGTNWQTYTYEYEMTDLDDPTGRLEFNLGKQGSTATFYLKNVTVTEVDK